MADSAPIRFGRDVSGNNTPTDNNLTVYGGEVLVARNRSTQFLQRIRTVTLESGIQAEFPETWRIGTERHEAGTELLGLDVETHKRAINLDKRPLVSHFDIDDIDEMLLHYSVRAEFSSKMGEALANGEERRAAMLIALAARDTGNGSLPGGNQQDINGSNALTATGVLLILGGIDAQVLFWDENDVPLGQRYCALNWARFHLIRRLGTLIAGVAVLPASVYASTEVNGATDSPFVARPDVLMYNGVQLFGTNNMPTEDVVDDGYETNYVGDYTKNVALLWDTDAVAWISKMGIKMATQRDERRGTDFFKASTLFGGGTLRPESAGEIIDS